jgi:hypothetical protein
MPRIWGRIERGRGSTMSPDYDDPEYFFWCQEKAAADVRDNEI